jgi:hypothetical protein
VTTLPGELAIAQCRCRVMLAIMLSSHVGNDATEATWPGHDVDNESCWRQCCRVMLAIMLPSHVGNDVARATWARRDVDAESCW